MFQRKPVQGSGLSPFLPEDPMPTLYPKAESDFSCDLLVICDGIGGLLIAERLRTLGVSVCVADACGIGFGTERFNGGVICSDMGMFLTDLRNRFGAAAALSMFRLLEQTTESLLRVIKETGSPCDLTKRDRFLFTEQDHEIQMLETEYIARRHCGFRVEFWDRSMGMEHFSFPFSAGIYMTDCDAELNPVRFAVDLAAYLSLHDVRILEHTEIRTVFADDSGFSCHDGENHCIHARAVIDARTVQLDGKGYGCSFYVATAPVGQFNGWYNKCILQNDRYLLRTMVDNRLMIGGNAAMFLRADGRFFGIPAPFLRDARYLGLTETLQDMFIGIEGLDAEFYFCETALPTETALRSVRMLPQLPHFYSACCSGKHLLLQAVLAGDRLRALLQEQPDPIPVLF